METGKSSKKSKQKKERRKLFFVFVCSFFVISLLAPFFFFSLVSLLFCLSLFWLRTGVWSRFPRQQRLNAGQSVLSQSGNATEKGKAANIIGVYMCVSIRYYFEKPRDLLCAGLTKKMTASNILLSQRASLGKEKTKKKHTPPPRTPPTHPHTHTPRVRDGGRVCVCVRVGVGGLCFCRTKKCDTGNALLISQKKTGKK